MGIIRTIVIGFVAGPIAKFLMPGNNEPTGAVGRMDCSNRFSQNPNGTSVSFCFILIRLGLCWLSFQWSQA